MNKLPKSVFTAGWDYTQESTFSLCPRKYFYIYEQGYEHTVGIAAHFSSYLIHLPLSSLYLAPDKALDWEAYNKKFLDAASPTAEMEGFYTLSLGKKCVEQYISEGYLERHLKEFVVVDSEKVTTLSLRRDEWQWIAKPDVILKHIESNKFYPLDFKSSKYAPKPNPFNTQFLGQSYTSWSTSHICVHFQLKKEEVIITETRVDDIPHVLMDEWKDERVAKLQQREACKQTGVWPKNAPDACYVYNQPCSFLRLCAVGMEAATNIGDLYLKEDKQYEYLGCAI